MCGSVAFTRVPVTGGSQPPEVPALLLPPGTASSRQASTARGDLPDEPAGSEHDSSAFRCHPGPSLGAHPRDALAAWGGWFMVVVPTSHLWLQQKLPPLPPLHWPRGPLGASARPQAAPASNIPGCVFTRTVGTGCGGRHLLGLGGQGGRWVMEGRAASVGTALLFWAPAEGPAGGGYEGQEGEGGICGEPVGPG